ncbi:MAG: amino acid permease [Alphaproteobacteria bacterium]|nr:amino acid permease [Alphaproteobacteria bacterium]
MGNSWRIKSLDSILRTAEKKSLHRTLGAFQLTLLGIGAVIGTGIFVLTAEAAQKAGPGLMLSLILAGTVCGLAALCYSELASMVPVAGSAYTYTYAVMGEVLAWMVGWALVLEYALGASAVCVGWANHVVPLINAMHIGSYHLHVPDILSNADGLRAKFAMATGTPATPELMRAAQIGGYINLPAVFIGIIVTLLLIKGTTESATVNAMLVLVKLAALGVFIILTVPLIQSSNFTPFMPNGIGDPVTGQGVIGAAASIFFAYVGFDAVSTAAEETVNPQRNVPIGLIASLLICTLIYMLVAAGAIGTIGGQPVMSSTGQFIPPGSAEMAGRCALITAAHQPKPLVCSDEALVYVLQSIHWPIVGRWVGLAAVIALPSVILMMIYGQTRVAFVMARDGLLPSALAKVHPKFRTPHVVTAITGVFVCVTASVLTVGFLADLSNAGTLFAFAMVAIAVPVLRRRAPDIKRSFKTPLIWLVAPLAVLGCAVLLYGLNADAKWVLVIWGAIGLVIYFAYSRRRSYVGRGLEEAPAD